MWNPITLRALKLGLAAVSASTFWSCTVVLVPTIAPEEWLSGSSADLDLDVIASAGGATLDQDNGLNDSILRLEDGRAGVQLVFRGSDAGVVFGLGFERQRLSAVPQFDTPTGPVSGPEESGDVTWFVERLGYQLSLPSAIGSLRLTAGSLFELAVYENPIFVNDQFLWQVNTFAGVSLPVGPMSLGIEWRTNDNGKLGDGPIAVSWSLRFALPDI